MTYTALVRNICRTGIPCALSLCLLGCATQAPNGIRTIAVPDAPKAAGPYSQGVISNNQLFTAGMLARDPATNALVQGDITLQATRVFDNLEAILRGAGCTFKDVVKVTVYMTDLNEFSKMNDVMAAKFGDHKPARTTVQVAKLPAGATLEIDIVARLPQ